MRDRNVSYLFRLALGPGVLEGEYFGDAAYRVPAGDAEFLVARVLIHHIVQIAQKVPLT